MRATEQMLRVMKNISTQTSGGCNLGRGTVMSNNPIEVKMAGNITYYKDELELSPWADGLIRGDRVLVLYDDRTGVKLLLCKVGHWR